MKMCRRPLVQCDSELWSESAGGGVSHRRVGCFSQFIRVIFFVVTCACDWNGLVVHWFIVFGQYMMHTDLVRE